MITYNADTKFVFAVTAHDFRQKWLKTGTLGKNPGGWIGFGHDCFIIFLLLKMSVGRKDSEIIQFRVTKYN